MGDQGSLSSFHRYIGIPVNFQEESSLVSFLSLELHRPLEVSREVRPPVQVRRGTSVSSRISTQDSDIPSSCQMKDEPAFKPLVLYFVEHGIAMEPMKGKWASCRVDLGYNKLF